MADRIIARLPAGALNKELAALKELAFVISRIMLHIQAIPFISRNRFSYANGSIWAPWFNERSSTLLRNIFRSLTLQLDDLYCGIL